MSGLSNDEDTPVAAAEVVEELTEEELFDRHRLELKVERAFREAGLALAQLRNRRLYRSTHSTFEAYCRDRPASHKRSRQAHWHPFPKPIRTRGINGKRINCSRALPASNLAATVVAGR